MAGKRRQGADMKTNFKRRRMNFSTGSMAQGSAPSNVQVNM